MLHPKKVHLICLSFLMTALCAGCVSQSHEISLVNIQQARSAVITYHSSGQYERDIELISNDAMRYLKRTIASGKYDKPAIVFDIDETLLSNYSAQQEMGFNFNPRYWRYWVNLSKAPAIKPILRLYNYALEKDIDVFIITGRKKANQKQTVMNLTQQGYHDWTNLFFKEKWDEERAAADYKSRIRKQLVEHDGYQIIANVGDQESDLTGGFAQKVFKLPNYIYIIR